jgi:hypothetical protein
MNIRFIKDDDLAAVDRLNRRVKAGGITEQISLSPRLRGEARYRPEGFPVYRRMMIAEDGMEVHAAVLLYHHNIFVHGEKRDFCFINGPLSEGIINPIYSLAVVQLMRSALSYQPFLMGLGVGSPDLDIFRFLTKLGWKHKSIPFFFYPVRVSKVLRGMNYFKSHPLLHYGALLGICSGVGTGMSGLLALRRKLNASLSACQCSVVDAFDEWADRIFASSLPGYGAAIRSDSTSLNIVYPPDDRRFIRLRVLRKSTMKDAGWIVVALKRMRDNPYFGDLTVGTLVDGFGHIADVPALVAAGINYLAEIGADLIVANFSHAVWARACRRSGMLSGPSNYQTFVTAGGRPLLEESCPLHEIHLTRGHSDGMSALI